MASGLVDEAILSRAMILEECFQKHRALFVLPM